MLPDRARATEAGLLRQAAQRRARLEEAGAGLRLHLAGGDPQQGGLARAIAPDQRHAFPGADREGGAGEERCRAEREVDVLEDQKGRGHATAEGEATGPASSLAVALATSRRGRALHVDDRRPRGT